MENEKFTRGADVIFRGNLAGVKGKVLATEKPFDTISDSVVLCVITDDYHPSGHSQRFTVVAVPERELDAAPAPGDLPEIQNL